LVTLNMPLAVPTITPSSVEIFTVQPPELAGKRAAHRQPRRDARARAAICDSSPSRSLGMTLSSNLSVVDPRLRPGA